MVIDTRELWPERVRPLRRAEYERLAALGEFEDERVELLGGMIVAMTPPGPRHASTVDRLNRILVRALGDRAIVRVQNPLALSEESEPGPDLALVPPGDYSESHPERAWLVIEVAESSVNKDKNVKAPLYASAGVPEYWVVDTNSRRIDVFRKPSMAGYAEVTSHGVDDSVRPEAFEDVTIAVADVLG